MNLRIFSFASLVLAIGAIPTASAVQVDSSWQIVLGDPDTTGVFRAHREAARFLQQAFQEGARMKLPIVERGKADPAKKGLFFGPAAATAAGFSTDGFGPYENVIAEKGGNIYFFGNDRAARKRPNVESARCCLPSVRAMTRFMETRLRTRFLMPGETGMAVLPSERVELADGTFDRENPAQVFGCGGSGTTYRYANGIFESAVFYCWGGHSYTHMVSSRDYYETHPEYFALLSGKRHRDTGNEILCISHPDIRRIMVDYLVKVFDDGADICELGPADSVRHCECARCRDFYGTGDDWCEKYWCFHRDIAADAYRLRPDKKVAIVCYGQTATPPKTFDRFTPNVMIENCCATERGFRLWDKYDIQSGFLAYIYLWGGCKQLGNTPKVSYARASVFARRMVRNRVKGIFRCGYGELWGLEGPSYWVFNRTLLDPKTVAREAVQEYCDFAYGPASAPMRRFHDTLDARLRLTSMATEEGWGADDVPELAGVRDDGSGRPIDHLAFIYAPATLQTMEESLARAEATPGLNAKEHRRLGLVRVEFDYVKNLGTAATLYNAYKAHLTWESFAPLADTILARNKMIDWFYSGKKGAMRRVPDWPEIAYFKNERRAILETNGRGAGFIGAPLGWDVEFLRKSGILPGAAVKRMSVRRTDVAPSFDDFEAGDWAKAEWQTLGGVQLQKIAKKGRFKMLAGPDALYLASETDAPVREILRFERDGSVWNDESHDLLIDPTGTRDVAYHFIWGPHATSSYDAAMGLVKDPLDPYYGKFQYWWNAAGWSHRDEVKGGTWRSLLKLPYAAINAAAPKAGERWCFNLGREWDFPCHGHPVATVALWSPNLESGSFVSPAAMGELVFE